MEGSGGGGGGCEKQRIGKKRGKKVQNSKKNQINFNGSFPIHSAREKSIWAVLLILFVNV